MKKMLMALLFAGTMHLAATAQVDPHFSEYYVYPSWLNPALTGAIDGDYRISGIYRNQWQNVSSFSTVGLSGDVVTNKNLNFGGSFMRQTAGTGGYTYTTAYLSVAYTGLRFGNNGNQRIVFGLQGGIISRRFDQSKFQVGNQWTPAGGFDPTLPTNESLSKLSSTVFDAGAGVAYYDADPSHKANVFVGFSGSHLTQPDDAFTTGTIKSKLPIRYTAHGGVKLTLSETFSLTPNLLYLRQGNAEEKMIGAYGQLKATDNVDFLLGANYRFKDAIVPFAGFYWKSFTLGLAYDVNSSDLGKTASGTTNSFELSLSYTGKKSKSLDSKHFICPRL